MKKEEPFKIWVDGENWVMIEKVECQFCGSTFQYVEPLFKVKLICACGRLIHIPGSN